MMRVGEERVNLGMWKVIKYLCKIVLAAMIAIILLSGICLLYDYSGIHITSKNGATDYVWENKQYKATMREGFSWFTMDLNGYNNMFDYSDSPDILLMGSSHMEAVNVAKDKNVGYLLNRRLAKYRTYNIGVSGHTVYRCVDNIDNAIHAYHPQKYLVLVIDEVDLSVEQMQAVIEDKATPIPSYDSGLIYWFQKVPAIKTIYRQLSTWASLDEAHAVDESETKENTLDECYDAVLKSFIDIAANACETSGIKLIIVYQPVQKLANIGELTYGYSQEGIENFKEICEKTDVIFCDMTEMFEKAYAEKHILAHGFSNTAVGEGHLNNSGHNLIANAIMQTIQELEEQ